MGFVKGRAGWDAVCAVTGGRGEQGGAEERKAGGLQQVRKLLLGAQKSARWGSA